MRNRVAFLGEDNKINNELYQLLNWRFKVECYTSYEGISFNDIRVSEASLVIVSMVGSKVDYKDIFVGIKTNHPEIPVVTISTRAESEVYSEFY